MHIQRPCFFICYRICCTLHMQCGNVSQWYQRRTRFCGLSASGETPPARSHHVGHRFPLCAAHDQLQRTWFEGYLGIGGCVRNLDFSSRSLGLTLLFYTYPLDTKLRQHLKTLPSPLPNPLRSTLPFPWDSTGHADQTPIPPCRPF